MAKEKIPREQAEQVAQELHGYLTDFCERWEIAGSIRRLKVTVSDVEIVYVPKVGEREVAGDLFGSAVQSINFMDEAVLTLEEAGILTKRPKSNGQYTYGPSIKLMVHQRSGVPIDFFAATEETWWSNLVCRTGGKESNTRVAVEAQKRGMKWHSTGEGFEVLATGEIIPVTCEEDVFRTVGMPCLPPESRS